MNEKYCLFSAPFNFLKDNKKVCSEIIKTEFKEIWYKEELIADDNLVAWITNPGQSFTVDEDILKMFPNLKIVITPPPFSYLD